MRVFWLLLLSAGMVCAGWLKREGRYATVEFNPGYETLADSLLNISDRVLPRLCALQGVDIRAFNARKTRIILTDAPDVTNGYAVENNVVIFVRSSSYLRGWSGPFTWYNLVLEHELAHHVTFRAIRRTSDWFGQFNLVSAPRWFFEGIAQYLAESWTPFRGDIFLKEEVINNRFTYDDLNNLDNGRLLYAAGHAYIRWLAATYGDSSLIRLMRHKPDAFYYDFEEAFEAVYGKDSEDLFPYFARYLTLHYGDRLADQTPFKPVNNLPAFGDRDLNIQPLPGRDSVYVVRTLLKKNHLFATALIGSVKNGEARVDKILSQDIQTPVYVSSDGQWLAWGRPHATVEEDQTATAFDWYMYNRGQNMKRHVATAIRAVEAAVDTSGVLYLATADGLASRLLRFAGPFHADTLFETANSLGAIRLADQKTLLFEAQSNRTAQRDLFQWRDGIIWQITNDSTEQRNPFIWNGDTLLYNTMIERHAALIMRAGRNDTLIDTREDIWLTGVDRARRAVMLAYRQADGRRYFTGYPLDSLLHHPLKTQHPVPAIHTDWIDKKAMTAVVPDTLPPVVRHTSHAVFPQGVLMPLQNLAFPVYDAQSGLSVFASSVWAEALQRHIIAVNGI
ncbi:MAG: hypothetical protein D6677_06030 [Calditrichaeota bacterium]|nr:MAG: hypothetical protein D6677_06030 [Calditrichota bacterium]